MAPTIRWNMLLNVYVSLVRGSGRSMRLTKP
jgi:hypothetical protein